MRKLAWLLIACLVSSPAFSQSSYRIPVSDPIYRVLDQLIAFDLVSVPIYGIRPWSAHEIQHQLDEARDRWQREKKSPLPGTTLREAAQAIKRRERIAELWQDVAAYEARWGTPDESAYRVDFLKSLAAELDATDPNYQWQSEHGVQVSRYVTGYARPFFEARFPESQNTQNTFSWHEVYGRGVWHNAALQVGRSALALGQSEQGTGLPEQPPELDSVQLMNDLPIHLPGIGVIKGIAYLATVNPHDTDHLLSGAKVQVQPLRAFALHAFALRALELGVGYATSIDTTTAQVDLRMTSHARGTQFYAETAWEDWDRAAFRLGLYMPRLSHSGTSDLRVEANRMDADHWGVDTALGYAVNAAIRVENRLKIQERAVHGESTLALQATPTARFLLTGGYGRLFDANNAHHFLLSMGFSIAFPQLRSNG